MRKAYVASRFALKEEVRKIYSQLAPLGFSISEDWTTHKPIKPYASNAETAQEFASDDVDGVRNADLFILISDEEGTGMHTELGVAIAHHLAFGKPLIYVIGKHNSRSLFFYHQSVNRRETIEQVLKELK